MSTEASWYHAHQAEIRRSDGQSAVGLASYITGISLTNESTGLPCTRNHPGDVLDYFSVAPNGAPQYFHDKTQLSKIWNEIERSETRINSQPAIHWNVAGSREFSEADHRAVAATIAKNISDRYGVVVVAGIHNPTDHGNESNWHYHFGHNMRRVGPDGIGEKIREITSPKTSTAEKIWVRGMVADVLNQRLELIGSNERVSHLSYSERGSDKEPMAHLGNKAKQLELKGVVTDIGEWNRAVQQRNAEREQQKRQSDETIQKLEAEIVDLKGERARRKKLMGLDDSEYKRTEQMKSEAREAGEAQAKEYGLAKDREKTEEFLRRFETDRSEGERKRQEELNARTGDPGIEDARGRYLDSLSKTSGRTTFDVLINAAKDEAAQISREHDKLTRDAALEKDVDKKNIILLRRDIQHADYMALVSERLEGVTKFNEGRSPRRELDEEGKPVMLQSERRHEEQQYWTKQGTDLRDELGKTRDLYETRQLSAISNEIDRRTVNQERGIDAQHQGANRYRHLDDQAERARDIQREAGETKNERAGQRDAQADERAAARQEQRENYSRVQQQNTRTTENDEIGGPAAQREQSRNRGGRSR